MTLKEAFRTVLELAEENANGEQDREAIARVREFIKVAGALKKLINE